MNKKIFVLILAFLVSLTTSTNADMRRLMKCLKKSKYQATEAASATALNKCNEELAAKENANVSEAELALIHQAYSPKISQLVEEHRINLNNQDRIILSLLEAIQTRRDEVNCRSFSETDYEAYGEFLARMAIQQHAEESKKRSAQAILCSDELFWQYVATSSTKELLATKNFDETGKLVGSKANFLVQRVRNSMSAIIGDMVGHATTGIIVDKKNYEEQNALLPTLVQGESLNYVELHIAPANENGVSTNIFSKFDMTRLDGLFIINSANEKSLEEGYSSGNENLHYSLTKNSEADVILIQIANLDPSSGTFLQGLIEVIGKKAKVIIKSVPGVIIDGAFFKNMESLYIETYDSNHMSVGPMGMHADSPVVFNSNYVTIMGPIYIPDKSLTFAARGICGFTQDGRIEELGSLQALCDESFLNYGSIRVQGPVTIETGTFVNQALWYWADWTPEMRDALSWEQKRGVVQINEWQCLPFDDIEGRQYEKMHKGSGTMLAHNYFIKATKGDIRNSEGAQIISTSPNKEPSSIFATGGIFNTHKHAFNHAGYYKQGFQFVPSVMNFFGNTELYSNIGQIKNEGSTINIHGSSTTKSGTDIINVHAQSSYMDNLHCKPHKWNGKGGMFIDINQFKGPAGCTMPGKGHYCRLWELEDLREIWAPVSAPAIFVVQGGNSEREAGSDIKDIGSIYYVQGDATDKAKGKSILESKIYGLDAIKDTIDRLSKLVSGGNEALVKMTGSALNPHEGGQPFGFIGHHVVTKKSVTEADGGIENRGGVHSSGEGTQLKTNGDIVATGLAEPVVTKVINDKNLQVTEHGFVEQPAVYESRQDIDMKSTGGSIHLHGTEVSSLEDITMSAKEIELSPLTTTAENSYKAVERGVFSTSTVTVRETVTNTINSIIQAKGTVKLDADTLSLEGGIITAKEIELKIDILKLKAHLIDHLRITDTTSKGLFFPGIGNIILKLSEGDFTSRSITNNIAVVAALDRLFNAKSASDLAPSILAAAEAYSIADNFSKDYLSTGSELAAITGTVLDQLQITDLGGVPIPAATGYGETKTHRESRWQEAVLPIISGGKIKIKTREAHIDAVKFKAEEDFDLAVTENLYSHGQPVTSSESFSKDGRSVTISLRNRGVGVSGAVQNAKSNSQTIQQFLPEIIAGKSVNINIGGEAEIEGVIKAPEIKLKVSGKLLLKTVQDKAKGSSSQKSVNAGVTISPAGITPSGGFQFGDGDWFRNWANQQATIEGTNVEIDVQKLILEGAKIIGQFGHVNAETLEFKDLVNTFESDHSNFGVDTNFLNFLMDPKNAPRVVAAANAIKGMAVVGSEDESAGQVLHATISQNLDVNTNSDIDGLNRDDSKAEGPVRKSSHKFSLALPVVDWQELGEGLERIGMTARDINQKRIDAFRAQREELLPTEPEKAAEWQEVIEGQAKITEIIDTSDLPEEKKLELAVRIALLFSEAEPTSGQYLVHSTSGLELSDKKKFTPISLQGEQGDFIYSTNKGAVIAVEVVASYGEDTYRYMAQYFDPGTVAEIKEIQSKWKIMAEKIGAGALDFGKGFVMVPIETLTAVKDSVVIIGEFYVDVMDGTFAKKAEAFNSLGGDDQLEIVKEVAMEVLEGIYENAKESLTTAKGWGGIVGDMAMGAGALKLAKEVKVASKLDGGGKTTILEETCPKKIGLGEREVGLLDKSGRLHNPLDAGDFGKKVDISVKLEFNQKFTDISHLPPLRQEYIRKVWGLEGTVYKLFNEGKTCDAVGCTVSQMRRDLGIKYKDLTPPELRERIYARNIKEYGDPLGPSVDHLRLVDKKSWEEIIESACRVGGGDLLLGTK